MLTKLNINCPKDPDKKYFSFKKQRYQNDLNIYVNDALLCSHINDAEEFLPIGITRNIELDPNKENKIKFEYNISFGPEKEKVDVEFTLKTNSVLHTKIHRYNYVQGSENLDNDYLVTFLVNGSTTLLDKSYHEGPSRDIEFDNYYSYPLHVRWHSRKPFTDTKSVYWDDIEFKLQ